MKLVGQRLAKKGQRRLGEVECVLKTQTWVGAETQKTEVGGEGESRKAGSRAKPESGLSCRKLV